MWRRRELGENNSHILIKQEDGITTNSGDWKLSPPVPQPTPHLRHTRDRLEKRELASPPLPFSNIHATSIFYVYYFIFIFWYRINKDDLIKPIGEAIYHSLKYASNHTFINIILYSPLLLFLIFLIFIIILHKILHKKIQLVLICIDPK